jgi:hypothetical protein
MARKAQTTLFMLLGVLLLIFIVLLLYLQSYSIDSQVETEEYTEIEAQIQNYVQTCIKETGEEALIFIAEHGGYYNLPELHDQNMLLPFYLYENESYMISKDKLSNQISTYINENLFFCLRNFMTIENMGYDIKQGTIKTITTILDNQIILNVNIPISVEQDGTTTTLTTFSETISTRINTVYNSIEEFMQIQEENTNSICISCLTVLGIENDLRTEMIPLEDNKMIFIFIDEQVLINEQPFEYWFINKYRYQDEE